MKLNEISNKKLLYVYSSSSSSLFQYFNLLLVFYYIYWLFIQILSKLSTFKWSKKSRRDSVLIEIINDASSWFVVVFFTN